MNVELTTDMNLVRGVLIIPEVWERAAEPNVDPESFEPGYNSLAVWLSVRDADEVIGVILVTYETSASIRMHPYMIPGTHELGREMMEAFYLWFMEAMQAGIVKVNVTIPMTDRKLYNFAKKVGFLDEGINRYSYRRGDDVYNQWNLGITKQEIEERIQWAA